MTTSGSRDDFKALVFDLDGTLYESRQLRRAMFWRIVRAHAATPWEGLQVLRAVQCYRQSQERLRDNSFVNDDLAAAQLQLACQLSGVSEQVLAAWVARWMELEPLAILPACLRHGTVDLLRKAKRLGYGLAVCSDYPATKKLKAMGIESFFDVVVTARDANVQQLKPHPKSLQEALHRLGVKNSEGLYVGDRPDVDAEAASRAGIKCVILDPDQSFAAISGLLTPRTCRVAQAVI